MGLLDGLEKLITEHGSAAILKERIALLNDKHAAVEAKVKELERTVSEQREQIDRLNGENSALKAAAAKPAAAPGDLDSLAQQLLIAVAESDGLYTRQLAAKVGCTEPVADFHLEEMLAAKLVSVGYTMKTSYGGGGAHWSARQEGRRYLMQRGLLK